MAWSKSRTTTCTTSIRPFFYSSDLFAPALVCRPSNGAHDPAGNVFSKVVVPFVEKSYPVPAKCDSRLLLGFSKSGWGAWSLLLRHPDVFGRAAAWDAPLMMDRFGKYGTSPIFGSQKTSSSIDLPICFERKAHRSVLEAFDSLPATATFGRTMSKFIRSWTN